MAKPDFSKLKAHPGEEEFTLYAIAVLKKDEHFSWDTLEQRFCKVEFHADDEADAANAVADLMEEMMKAGEDAKAPWFPMKMFHGDDECTHALSDVLFDREIIKITPVEDK